MEYINALGKAGLASKVDPKYVKTLLLLIAPFAPYLAEELYQKFDERPRQTRLQSIHTSSWPSFDEKEAQEDQVFVAVQINGKLRDVLSMDLIPSQEENKVKELAMKSPKIQAHLASKKVKNLIFVKGKVLNLVTN